MVAVAATYFAPHPELPGSTSSSRTSTPSPRSHHRGLSCSKYVERQIIRAWKTVTGAARKSPRASFMPSDFVLVTAARRRSTLMV
ncbi:hypothetical protein PLICRDRAFT_43020 [Plicaturopsis crispa FD-325 SS-3]|nr:hypothetical protein PLICRDRAFT_43020 [Plicaturopsis crispa FD-325 SS-3]